MLESANLTKIFVSINLVFVEFNQLLKEFQTSFIC